MKSLINTSNRSRVARVSALGIGVLAIGALTAGSAYAGLAPAGAPGTAPQAAKAETSQPVLRQGSHGPAVRHWQSTLNQLAAKGKPSQPRVTADGVFGPKTTTATKNFQRWAGIPADGIVGPHTRAAADKALGGGGGGGVHRCYTSQLHASTRLLGPATGNRGMDVKLTNTSKQTCTVYGYAGFGLENAGHAPQPSTVKRGSTYFAHDPGAHTVRLAPGHSVHANLAWTVVPIGNDPASKQCRTYTYLEITPPGAYSHTTVKFGHHVCGHGRLTTTAMSAG